MKTTLLLPLRLAWVLAVPPHLGHPAQSDYAPNPMYASPAMLGGSPDLNTAGAFGRMTLSPDHALEKLAANVRPRECMRGLWRAR